MAKPLSTKLAGTLAASLSLALGACTGNPGDNRTLYSVRQPVVERSNFTMDVAASYEGVPVSEQQRLAAWFESIDLKYGDRVALDDPSGNPGVKEDIAKLAARYGLLVEDGVPVTSGNMMPGSVRVVVTRSVASVPDCPNWTHNGDDYGNNVTSTNFGCAVNGNLAAMVANPEDLLHGRKGTGETTVVTSTKAIKAYRDAEPTGVDGLPQSQSDDGGK